MGNLATSNSSAVTVSIENSVAWVTLNRPEKINSINDSIRQSIPPHLKELDENPEVRVIVIRGSGERGFCAGADINEKRPPETQLQTRQRIAKTAWIESLDCISKPIIAAIHGYCFGGGLELALACDIRFASPNALFALPEVNLGLIPGGGGTQRLTQLIGLSKALDILMTGERFNAEKALNQGIVTRVASNETNFHKEVTAFASFLAQKPPTAIAFVKEAAKSALTLTPSAGFTFERDLFSMLQNSKERLEAAAAFRDKRKPNFD